MGDLECVFLMGLDEIDVEETERPTDEKRGGRQCSVCDEIGHRRDNCPVVKGKARRARRKLIAERVQATQHNEKARASRVAS